MKHIIKNTVNNDIYTFSQKIDGCSFKAQKINYNFTYYNRNTKINIVLRHITDLYEDAISIIEKLPYINDDFSLSFEYFSNKINPIIDVIKPPKNHLVLYNSTNSNIEWEKYFEILPKYNIQMNDKKWNYLFNNEPTIDIIKQIIPNFVPIINDKEIEGIVIEYKNEISKYVNSKYTQTIIDKKETYNSKKEYIDIICNHTNFYLNKSFKSYLEWCFYVYEYNIDNWLNMLKSHNIDKNILSLNWKLIPTYLHKHIQTDDQQTFFRLFLYHFQKIKNRQSKDINKDSLLKINNIVFQRGLYETI